ncbi:sn-glycerol-3-phosphate ABC transporter permease UgpE [Natronospirillum operosum]|uniref:sn-glycerol-3-phosphate transport system permease protein UgpE n=1 Tax=Natronospirillum operosum TaxID=2759953 RepID=A0A4Z0W1Z8_9GAMM|nr:sn-glycerol-3-phosphate ABC transporter permease UgpE [Natronospirillum operosum]TGG90256.1 sn-glycerol-3-phosphate ABC transporter permease UgpE [Natronospirillum operosum]
MIENRPWLTAVRHLVLILGIIVIGLPIWIALVASTNTSASFVSGVMPMWFGEEGLNNFRRVLTNEGRVLGVGVSASWMMWNSFIMAMVIAIGKITISILSAFAIVYFRFPFRRTCFWMIFITLMLPVEVRILPTYEVVASLGMLNSYAGLTIPLIASATATFLFRQFFLSIPDSLAEAARIDGAGPMKFFKDILLPLSVNNIAALFVILFIYGWNQYLWPLLITTDENYYTIVMVIKRLMTAGEGNVPWNIIMTTTVLAMLPPVVVVLVMQKFFVRGLVEQEK